ncbi:hypothetical protein [Marinitoga lauensis]|uniref:hypothetical protein n=1 Tax=Marinitoga lauensis TaxID=2201189 RepID=UPI001010E0A4|nr:hypothetical protein [Marinitoga lauensis]
MAEYLYYFPIEDNGNKNRIKELIEKDFKRKGSKTYKKLKQNLIDINKGGREYILFSLYEENSKKHNNKKIARIDKYNDFVLYELRIPQQSKNGVFRIYFTFYPVKDYPNNNNVIILEAEFKTDKEAKKIDSAFNNLKILVDALK